MQFDVEVNNQVANRALIGKIFSVTNLRNAALVSEVREQLYFAALVAQDLLRVFRAYFYIYACFFTNLSNSTFFECLAEVNVTTW